MITGFELYQDHKYVTKDSIDETGAGTDLTVSTHKSPTLTHEDVGAITSIIAKRKSKNKGLTAFSEIRDIQLRPININRPKSRFEIQIVQAYNRCRKKYLHKYLNVLNDTEINALLEDNYIQKIDVQKVLKSK